jgi:DNA modification methylase
MARKNVTIIHGDCREAIKEIAENSVDSCVTDPPYALVSIVKRFGNEKGVGKRDTVYNRASAGFMGQKWDTGETAFDPNFWHEVLLVLKPGAHLVAFGGTRTYHRMACAIEDAGFEIRDQLQWMYGSGFPKSHDVSKGIDREAGVERKVVAPPPYKRGKAKGSYSETRKVSYDYQPRQLTAPATDEAKEWEGWGTALKPAVECIVLARKPLSESTVAANVLRWSTGALNIDGCRVGSNGATKHGEQGERLNDSKVGFRANSIVNELDKGRWPANVVHDGSAEVLAGFPETVSSKSSNRGLRHSGRHGGLAHLGGNIKEGTDSVRGIDDFGGSAARFFYTAKADKEERVGSNHPTVKPLDLMQWLVRLVTPPNGFVLDPFAGTGTTGEAAFREGMRSILIEREAKFVADIRKRVEVKYQTRFFSPVGKGMT